MAGKLAGLPVGGSPFTKSVTKRPIYETLDLL